MDLIGIEPSNPLLRLLIGRDGARLMILMRALYIKGDVSLDDQAWSFVKEKL